ncbi:hypothetical protein [Pseudoalteromonas rubra]|uniref:Lipoprotein n=1 Tax=Pseudoalteromonas rubra TaxID=43658 RepID=A0A5S3X3H0_9GAMM|nr:hypothetical protein [Pseudoalteromonas rubra]TMP39000.1 hypothetical protein CWB98_04755 [Pseudoalteromonas rubra]
MNKLIVTLVTLFLTACGGGSGESQGQNQANNNDAANDIVQGSVSNATQAQAHNVAEQGSDTEAQLDTTGEDQSLDTQPEEEDVSAEGMEAVVVDETFDFQTDVPVSVLVASNIVDTRAFINICQKEATLTNDDTCFLRAPIDSNGLIVQIVLPHSEQKLKAEIWYYSTDKDPLVYSWEFDGSQQQQTWEIN